MCSVALGLMAAQTGLQLYGQNAQYHAQKAQYEAQQKQATLNAAIESHKQENLAENYAQKQKQLQSKYNVAVGRARAAAGASGLTGEGSVADVLDSSYEAYKQDSQNLLSSQRQDSWASYVNQVNYQNEANAYNQAKHQAKANRNFGYFNTILGAAASMYGQANKED